MPTATANKPVLAIDPGPVQSAWVLWDGEKVQRCGINSNDWLSGYLDNFVDVDAPTVVIEMIASYGMPVGKEVFETCVWIGRFIECCRGADRITRGEVKNHLCHSSRAKDSNIRQALIDRVGPQGTKKNPGPCYGLKADMWAALAVAVTWWDKHAEEGK